MTATETECAPGRVRVWFESTIRDESRLPEAITQPTTYQDIWSHARRGSWTSRNEHSVVRIPATVWAAAAIVCTGAGELTKWTVDPDGKPWNAVRTPRTPAQVWAHASPDPTGPKALRACITGQAAAATVVAGAIDLATWSVQRFTRFITVTTTTLLIGTAAAQLPILGGLVPTLINITAW